MARLTDCNAGGLASARVDRVVLGALLESAGLLDRVLAGQAARIGGRFPVIMQRDMFLEYELADQPIPAGFGLGFPAGTLDHYLATRHWFLRTSTGRSIRAAMADDPFAADSRTYLNLFGDPDPDWIEYDIADRRIDAAPFVFFRLPTRFRSISTPEEVRALCGVLPGGVERGDFADLLALLIALAPATPYRIGVARSRGAGWWRAIVTDLRADQVASVLERRGVTDVEALLTLASRVYADRLDTPGACFALSIDVDGERISAIDVECPYLFRIADPKARTAALAELADGLVDAGVITAPTAAWIVQNGSREVVLRGEQESLVIRLHHLKYRLFGAPRPRIKAYLHLSMPDGSGREARP